MTPFVADIDYIPKSNFDSSILRLRHEAARSIPLSAKKSDDFAALLQFQKELVKHNLLESQDKAEVDYNKHRRELLLVVGDLVLVHRNARLFNNHFKYRKMKNLFFGSYAISKKYEDNPNIYELDLGISPDYSRTVNVKNLKPYFHDTVRYPTQPPSSPPMLKLFARNGHIKQIVGLDERQNLVSFIFKNCDPFHGVIFDLTEAKMAIPSEYWNQLHESYLHDIDMVSESESNSIID